MWLSDDDWLDPGYVARCLAALQTDSGLAIAWGTARYYRDGRRVIDERPMDLRARRPGVRVISYFARVSVNGPLFGLMRRSDLLAAGGFPRDRPETGSWWRGWRLGSGAHAPGRALHRSIRASARARRNSRGRRAHRRLGATPSPVGRPPPARGAPVSPPAAALSSLLVVLRFPGIALVRRAGLGRLEPRVAAWLGRGTCEAPVHDGVSGVAARDEEEMIEGALRSLRFCDEIVVVVDDRSTDRDG